MTLTRKEKKRVFLRCTGKVGIPDIRLAEFLDVPRSTVSGWKNFVGSPRNFDNNEDISEDDENESNVKLVGRPAKITRPIKNRIESFLMKHPYSTSKDFEADISRNLGINIGNVPFKDVL